MTTALPSAATAARVGADEWVNVADGFADGMSQSLTTLSDPPEASRSSHEEDTTERTWFWWPFLPPSARASLPAARSQSFIVLSKLPVATDRPSGLTATL